MLSHCSLTAPGCCTLAIAIIFVAYQDGELRSHHHQNFHRCNIQKLQESCHFYRGRCSICITINFCVRGNCQRLVATRPPFYQNTEYSFRCCGGKILYSEIGSLVTAIICCGIEASIISPAYKREGDLE